MFDYTKAAFKRIGYGVKLVINIIKIGSFALTMLYFGIMLALNLGHMWANIAMLVLTLFAFIFDLVTDKKKKETKEARKTVKRVVAWSKIAIKTVTLGITIYGIYIASSTASPISIILATLMIILWVLQVVFQVIFNVIEDEASVILEGVKEDFKPITTAPKKIGEFVTSVPQKVGAFFDRLQGKETPPPEPKTEEEPSPEIEKLKKFMEKEKRKEEKKKKVK